MLEPKRKRISPEAYFEQEETTPIKHEYYHGELFAMSGDIEFVGERKDIVANPQVIVEVLSQSTQDYDRGSKFRAYREMGSLADYILIDQFSVSVEYFHREESGRWTLQDLTQMDDSLVIQSLDIVLPLERIYHRVEI